MRIGLTYTGTEEKHENYVRWLKQRDDVEVTTLSADDENKFDVKSFDGIVLSGGVDMHPKFYNNETTDYADAPEQFNEQRDIFEINIFKQCLENELPLLCVCRGMQLANCFLGGNLTQDLEGLNKIHRFEKNDKAHGVNILAGSLLNEIAGIERSVVNSAHHQAVNELGKGLQVNCIADDGIIEGLEWIEKKDKPFFLCIQWHPERMYKLHLQETPLSKNIRDRFIEEVKKVKQQEVNA